MTPEQEILEDALLAARQRAVSFAEELRYHGRTLPLDPTGNAVASVVAGVAKLGIVDDAARWERITRLRNSFAHDYPMTLAELVPLLNQARAFAPDVLRMVDRVERHVADEHLLEAGSDND